MDVEHNYWGWWPIITLVICAITVFGVFRAVLWIIRWSGTEPAGPVDLEATHKIVRPAGGWQQPVQEKREPQPVQHLGVEGWRARELRPLTPLDDRLRRALTEDTAGYNVVFDEPQEQIEITPVDNLPALIVDELGAWDPDAVDWLEPAMYIETVHHTLRTRPDSLPDRTKIQLANNFRRSTVSAMDAMLTGV